MPQQLAGLVFFFHDLIVYILIMLYKLGGFKLTSLQAMLVQREGFGEVRIVAFSQACVIFITKIKVHRFYHNLFRTSSQMTKAE